MRGVGYLYHYWNMILLATVPSPESLRTVGRKVVMIRNMMNEEDHSHNHTTPLLFPVSTYIERNGIPYMNCSLWTIYVRVNGPEIFAGSADAVVMTPTPDDGDDIPDRTSSTTTTTTTIDASCHWEFPFHIQIPGTYLVDVKVLYYNASSIMESPCDIHEGTVNVDVIPKSRIPKPTTTTSTTVPNSDDTTTSTTELTTVGFKGFKMYSPAAMCCEICSRLYNDCTYWATPPLQFINETYEPPSRMNNGCDLFYYNVNGRNDSKSTSEWSTGNIISMFVNNSRTTIQRQQYPHRQRMLRGSASDYHGPPNGERHTYFVGCGWSFWMTLDFPCINGDLDDRVYVMADGANNTFTFAPVTMEGENIHPTTATNHGTGTDIVRDETQPQWTNATGTVLPLCTLEMEQPNHHVGRWVRYPWPNTTICPFEMEADPNHSQQFVIMKHDPYHPQCYFRDDLSIVGHTCMEMNCRFIPTSSKWTTSSLHLEQQWYGYYELYRCRYHVEYTDEQLQICIDERKIYKIDGSGQSIWHFLRQYLYHRISHLKLYDNEAMDGLEIHLSSLQLTHEPLNTLRTKLMEERPVLDSHRIEFYWVNSVYMSSEREQEARGAVQLMKSAIAQDVLGPRNYYMLNLYDMTKAFTYDTATQMDGFHIIGPPMKMLISKLFHYMCYNTSVMPR